MTEVYDWNTRRTRRQPPAPPGPAPIVPEKANTDAYGQAALTNELHQLLQTTEGGRNDQLNRSAFNLAQLVAAGRLAQQTVDDQLRAAAHDIGLTRTETEATLASARRAGQQLPRDVPELTGSTVTEVTALQLAAGQANPDADQPEHDGERQRSSWWPQPIAHRAALSAEEPAPTHLIRDDGQPLFYSGKVNGLIGESESGKSWIALLAVVQAVNAGQQVLFLDFEDSAASVQRRLQSLGLTHTQLEELVDYADPDETLGLTQSQDLAEALTQHYAVIIADGINAAMTLLGYDLNSNTDATLFTTKLLRPLARTGACVVTVDHVPKNPDGRGKGGIGAQAKRAMMDGACLLVEVDQPFGKGHSGSVRLTVDKDRNGAVRGASAGGRYAGKAHLESVGDQVRMHITGPDLRSTDERPTWRPTGVMEKVSQFLERVEGAPSFRAIKDAISGRDVTIREAITGLVEDGHVRIEIGPHRTSLHHLIKPYREPDNATESSVSGRVPVSPGHGEAGVSRAPSPYGEGHTQADTSEPPVNPTETGHTQPELAMPEGHSSCNRCGTPTPDQVIDETAGYCRSCGRLMNP